MITKNLSELIHSEIYIASLTNTRYGLKDAEIKAIGDELDNWLHKVIGIAKKYNAKSSLSTWVRGSHLQYQLHSVGPRRHFQRSMKFEKTRDYSY
jgi:hypothetical protein